MKHHHHNNNAQQYWQDLETSKLFLICKTTGTAVEVGRDYNVRPVFDREVTGRMPGKERHKREASMPKLPLYLQRHSGILRKFQSVVVNKSVGKGEEEKDRKRYVGRYSVHDQLEDLQQREMKQSRKRYISLQVQNQNQQTHKTRLPSPQIGDEKDFFKLTRYRIQRMNPSSNYHFTVDPQQNDYPKPVPLHSHVTISKALIEKKLLIESLQEKCSKNPENNRRSIFRRRQEENTEDPFRKKGAGGTRNSVLSLSGEGELKRIVRMEAERKQKLLMERFYLKQMEERERQSFIRLLKQKQG